MLNSRVKKFLILLLLLIPFIKVDAIVQPSYEFFVNDQANILSSSTEEYIISKSAELERVDGTQIVVVTVKNLEGSSIEQYANELFESYGIGDKDKNNGLLLILSL